MSPTSATALLPSSVRTLTRYLAVAMAFALGFLFAFATKLEPHLVAIAVAVATFGAVYCVLLAIYLWLRQRTFAGRSQG